MFFYGSFICAFWCSNKLVLVTLYVLRCQYLLKRHYLLPISIVYATMLSKQGYICHNIAGAMLLFVVLLKQCYSSYNNADSRCTHLKIIGSILFVTELPKQHHFAGL